MRRRPVAEFIQIILREAKTTLGIVRAPRNNVINIFARCHEQLRIHLVVALMETEEIVCTHQLNLSIHLRYLSSMSASSTRYENQLLQIGFLKLSKQMYTVSKTHIQASASVDILRKPDIISFSRFTVRVSGDPISSTLCQTDMGIILSTQVEPGLLDGIAVNSRLCIVQLVGSVCVINR